MTDRGSPVLTSTSISQSPRATGTDNVTTFKNILQEVSISLSFREGPHTLGQEQALIVRDLEKALAKSPQQTDRFLKGLEMLCKKEKNFRKCVLPTRLRKNGDLNDTNGEAYKLSRTVYLVDCLQKQIMNILLEEITSISSEDVQDTSWLRLLLNPMRYLPHICDPATLTTKLLDILDVANFPAQLEILDSVPEIIPDSQYAETAKQLSKLLDENDDLTASIVDCLNALDLDSDTRVQVQDRILAKILAGASLKIFPVLLQFLMTDCKSQTLVGTLFKVRNALDTIMLSVDKSKDRESSKIVIFNRLQALAVSPKNVAEAWLNMISSIKVHSDHRPVDYLILIMLHSTAKFKKRVIEAIFRKRIDSGLFKIALLEKMFEKYLLQQLLKDYFGSIVEIGCSLLRSSNETKVVEFASALFKMLFEHEHTETLYQREMLESLILLTGASDRNTVNSVLRIISSLLTDSDKLQQHTKKIDAFELKDVKEVFEVLCKLTCGEQAQEAMSGLKDEIHMVVRKQLSSSKRNVKHRGIISRGGDGQTPETPVTLNDLPYGPAREAACLLELTSTCTGNCPDFTGLYYDQLAMMLAENAYFDKYFMAWLHETVTSEFEETYVTETIPDNLNDLKVSMQYLLNASSELDSPWV
ncbi:hypothetical protein NQ318_017462 [Aromia moschata]|uniref:Fanconi anemia group D2 protein n=1 Tax=Aromia moschata TaxID=1265417 RepID=A0AAV8Z2C1_9CUCU|nr:hypothetical protein NQ318_017462 [Aromia moschata]